jgi:4-amino-4-deoxy-L-arabinose transferase-like glycosyltransferase
MSNEVRLRPSWMVVLLLIAMVGLGVRAAYSLSKPSDGEALQQMLSDLPDQREYLQAGMSIIEQGELSFVDPRFGTLVRAFRMPGYPALVALCNGNVTAIRTVHAFMDATTAVLAGLIAWRITRSTWAMLLAAAIVALNPYLIYFSSLILTESATTLLLTSGVWALLIGVPPTVKGIEKPVAMGRRVQWWFGVVVVIGAIYFRPSLIALPVVLAAMSGIVIDRPGTGLGRRVPVVVVVGMLTFLSLLPWAIRNRAVTGEWIFTTTNTGFTWYDGYNPAATGASDQRFTQVMPELSVMNETRRSEYLSQMASNWAKDHPLRSLELAGVKLARTFSPVPLSDQFGGRLIYIVVGGAFAIPVMALAVVGLWQGRVHRGTKLFLLLPIVYLGLMHAVTVGSLRYRMPIEPIVAVLAATGAVSLVSKKHDNQAT